MLFDGVRRALYRVPSVDPAEAGSAAALSASLAVCDAAFRGARSSIAENASPAWHRAGVRRLPRRQPAPSARRSRNRIFYGFDSFGGLPRDGRPDWQIDFTPSGQPHVPANCRLVPGWFAETIPAFVRETTCPIAFVNIDCDIYSSARTVLFGLGERLRPGTILYFDELVNYDTFLWNEMLAFFEFLEATGLGVEWLAAHCRIRGVDEVLSYFEAGHYPSWGDDVAAGYHRPAAAVLTSHSADLGLLRSSASAARVSSLAAKFEHFTRSEERSCRARVYFM